jgi:DNA-directed RNA polymerase subunit M/transcription elongation factor TFIIS
MKFCEKCGAYMRATKTGLQCTKCGNTVLMDTIEVKTLEQRDVSPIAVVSEPDTDLAKVSETCPACGNSEALRNISFISGEHAGVRQERSMERFTCTKCGHSWTKQ